jgi:hypothetical protein
MENKDSKSLTLGTKKINKTEQSKNNRSLLIVLFNYFSCIKFSKR